MRRLEERLKDAEKRARPNQLQLDRAMVEVIRAYAGWQALRNQSAKAAKEAETIKAQMEERRLGVKDREEMAQIKKMKRFLRSKYNQGPL